jgi:hypothetical protein
VGATAEAGWLAAGFDAARPSLLDSDPELAMLLRFMAGVKAAIALAVLGITAWRLGHPATPAVALLYLAAVSLMCAAPGMIWQLAYVGVGAGLFHAGLLLLLGALVADRGEATQLVGTALRRARRTLTCNFGPTCTLQRTGSSCCCSRRRRWHSAGCCCRSMAACCGAW